MSNTKPLSGVFAAAITPFCADGKIDFEAFPLYLEYLCEKGCHGALILGTTGEGPSVSLAERVELYRTAVTIKNKIPYFHLLAGTGTPSLEDTIALTRSAFDAGMDGVVVLPPYYYHKANEEGLFAWYQAVLQRSVPDSGRLLVYHIPQMTKINLSLDFFRRLKDEFPNQFTGLKDSSGDIIFASQLGKQFDGELTVFTGNDRLFGHALRNSASGCITAGANLFAPLLRQVWDAHQQGITLPHIEKHLCDAREILDKNPPASALIKGCLPHLTGMPKWSVRPPLMSLSEGQIAQACQRLDNYCGTQII